MKSFSSCCQLQNAYPMEVSEILFREINSGDFSKNSNVTFLSGRYLMFDKSTEHSNFPEVLETARRVSVPDSIIFCKLLSCSLEIE